MIDKRQWHTSCQRAKPSDSDLKQGNNPGQVLVSLPELDREAGGHRDGNFDRLAQRVPFWVVPA